MKPTLGHLVFLDYFRGIAILGVFFFHNLYNAFGKDDPPLIVFPALLGWVGVPIFFTISGFCIHLSYQRSREKGYQRFFIRRFFRIYPPYFLAVLFFGLVFSGRLGWGLKTHDLTTFMASLGQLGSHIFLVHNFRDPWYFGISAAFWSIAVEAQLYLLYPLLVFMAFRQGWSRMLWVTGFFELGLRSLAVFWAVIHPASDLPRLYTGSPLYYWFTWTMGAVLADAWLNGKPLPFRGALGFLWPVLFFVCHFFKPLDPFCYPLAALTSISLVAYCLSLPPEFWTGKASGSITLESLRWAGIVSYSAYLIHLPLLNAAADLVAAVFPPGQYSPLFEYALCLLSWFPIFCLSYVAYRFVELPSIAFGKWLVQRNLDTAPAREASMEMEPSS